jgi:hypothetical protein
MTAIQQLDGDAHLRRYEDGEKAVAVADFGPGRDATVDVVDGTAIVIVDDEQYDVDVAAGAEVFMRNGVLTIEVEQ